MLRDFVAKRQAPLLFVVAVLAFSFTSYHVIGLLPTVMQDEYLYSMASRHLPMSEAQIPDYLFYWVYSSTSLCGPAFYTCAKSLNLVFLAGTSAFVFLIARARLSMPLSVLLAIITFAGPMSIYSSFFMPDVMFYCFTTAFIWFLLKLDASTKHLTWAIAGAILGLASLTKPHALFLAPAVAVLIVYVAFSSRQKIFSWSVLRITLLGLSTLFTKFALGFLWAGVNGLSLFGTAYTGTIENFVSNTSMKSDLGATDLKVETVLNSTKHQFLNVTTAADTNANGAIGWLYQQILGHFGGIILIAGFGLVIVGSAAWQAIKNRQTSTWLDRSAIFSVAALVINSAVVVAFTVLLTANGHPHSDRILFRYFEYLIPLVWVFAVIFSGSSLRSSGVRRWVSGALFVAALAVAAAQIPRSFTVNFFDTTYLNGLVSSPGILWFHVAATALLVLLWSSGSKKLLTPFLVIFLVFGSVTTAQASYVQVSSRLNPDYYDTSAAFVKDYLDPSQLARLTVVGVNDWAIQRTLFALDSPDVDFRILKANVLFDPQYLSENKDWVLILGDVAEATKPTYQIAGNGYLLARYSKVPEFNFSQEVGSGLVSSATGLGRPESWGAWTVGKESSVGFAQAAPANAVISLTMAASQSNAGKTSIASMCGSAVEFQVSSEPTTAKLTFANSQPCSELTITNPIPVTLGASGAAGIDNRLVGYKLFLVQFTK